MPLSPAFVEVDREAGADGSVRPPLAIRSFTATYFRELTELGFSDLQAHLHWPTFETCRAIIPIGSGMKEPLCLLLDQRFRGRFRLGLGRGMGWLASQLPRCWVSCFSILGRRGPGDGENTQITGRLARFAAPVGSRSDHQRKTFDTSPQGGARPSHSLPPERLGVTLLTPRFRASRNVTFLGCHLGGGGIRVVAKTPRLREDGSALQAEAKRLDSIQSLRPGGFDSLPRILSVEEFGGRTLLIESALPGLLLSPTRLRRSRRRACRQVTSWLIDFHLATRRIERPDLNGLLMAPLERIGRALPRLELVTRSRQGLSEILHSSLPTVCEHGDLSHPNLILESNTKLGVVDWGWAEIRGLPTVDLFFFLIYATRAGEPLNETALERTFHPREGWALPFIDRYARQLKLDRNWLRGLFIACWVRSVARTLDRLRSERTDLSKSQRDWLVQHPYVAAWEYALRWEGPGA